jgi:hypothetical protein
MSCCFPALMQARADREDRMVLPTLPRHAPARCQTDDPARPAAAAGELPDRYLNEVNAGRLLPAAQGKDDVSRPLTSAPSAIRQGRTWEGR